MSAFDSFKLRKRRSTRQEIGAKSIDAAGVETYQNEYLVYFLISPVNIAVLSESGIRGKVLSLMNVLKEMETVEIACLNSRETFAANKNHLKEQLSAEKNAKVREILEKDAAFLDRMQIQTASAREFLLIVRFDAKAVERGEVSAGVSRAEKLLKDQGFMFRRAGKEDIKRIFSVYFVQNLTQVYFEDFDGGAYLDEGGYLI